MDEKEYYHRWQKYQIDLVMAKGDKEKKIQIHKEFFNCTHENKKPFIKSEIVKSDTKFSDGYWYGDKWVDPLVVPGTKMVERVIAEDIACNLCFQKDPRKREMIYKYTVDEIYNLDKKD